MYKYILYKRIKWTLLTFITVFIYFYNVSSLKMRIVMYWNTTYILIPIRVNIWIIKNNNQEVRHICTKSSAHLMIIFYNNCLSYKNYDIETKTWTGHERIKISTLTTCSEFVTYFITWLWKDYLSKSIYLLSKLCVKWTKTLNSIVCRLFSFIFFSIASHFIKICCFTIKFIFNSNSLAKSLLLAIWHLYTWSMAKTYNTKKNK